MDEARHRDLMGTSSASSALLDHLRSLNRQFCAELGTVESRHQLDHEAREAQGAHLRVLADQGQLLREELLSLHTAYQELYPVTRDTALATAALKM